MSNLDFTKSIAEASLTVGKTWPLYSFVTSNPLAGYEGSTFEQAIKQASENLGSFTLPSGRMFRQAWQNEEIDLKVLQDLLVDAKFKEQPEFYLNKLEVEKPGLKRNPNHILDTILTKWLNAFLDEGIAEWEMPNKEMGFYSAWRGLAIYDQEIGVKSVKEIPETANEALTLVLNTYSVSQQIAIFKYHIAALPGYTGYIKYRMTEKANQLPGVHSVTAISGFSIMNGSGGNYGFGFVKLDPFDERNTDDTQIDAIVGRLFGVGATVADANMIFFTPPSIQGFGSSSGVEFSLIDKSGGDLENLDEVAKNFSYALSQRPEMQYAQTSFNINFPQYEMDINVPRAMEAGVSVNNILSAMQGYIGGLYSANFSKYGKQYRVMIQASPDDRNDIGSINKLYVRTNTSEMTPISQFVEMKRVYGPQTVNRFNLFQAAGFNGATNPGYSTGDAINVVNEVASQVLPNQFDIMYSGLTREEVNSGSQASIIFVLSLIFVYFLLSAQYESYVVPFSVILSLPFGVMGAYLGQWAFGLENNIYFQIALIMLIGLLAKNAILIVEFALQRRRMGKSISMAAIDAAKARLRPILMTSFAFIFGMLPLVFASGTGAVGNRSIATGAASGLLIGTIFGVIVIPVLFVIFQKIQEKIVPMKFDLYEEQMKIQENEQ